MSHTKRIESVIEKDTSNSIDDLNDLLNNFPTPFFEEDFTEAQHKIDSLRESGIDDITAYLKKYPETVRSIAQSIKISRVNYAMLALYGLESLDQFYKTVDEIVPESSYDDFILQLMTIIDGADYFEQEFCDESGMGKQVFTILTVSVIDREKYGLSKVMINVTDISERRRVQEQKRELEERLKQAEKFEAIGLIAGSVAHDLNNVLIGVVSFSDMLLYGMDDNDSLNDSLSFIRDAGLDAADIVQDLLSLSKRGTSDKEPVNLNTIITEVLDSSAYRDARTRQLEVEVRLDLSEDLKAVNGSPPDLRKMLLNLLLNIQDKDGQEVLVEIKSENCDNNEIKLEIPDKSAEEYIKITVTEHGTELSEVDITKIFDPFYSKKKLGYSGSGLGMTIVQGVVLDSKGFIRVSSTPGFSTEYKIFLPVINETVVAIQAKEVSDSIKGKGELILVIDDMDIQRTIGTDVLKTLEYEVVGAESGKKALELIERGITPDLILLDMIMPDMDGLETYLAIKELLPDIKVVIVSGYAESYRVRTALQEGVNDYVSKPYTLKHLGQVVRDVLDQKTD